MKPNCLRILFCVAAIHSLSSAAMAQQSKAIWGMLPGDSFSVSSVVVRSTELQQGAAAPVTMETRDRCFLEYRLQRISPDGDALIDVRVSSPTRETRTSADQQWKPAAPSQRKLDGIALEFQIDPQGNITNFAPQDRDQLIALLSGNDAKYASLLSSSLPSEVVAGWFGRIFSVPQHRTLAVAEARGDLSETPANAGKDDPITWSHAWVDSIGPFGVIRSSVEFQTKENPNDDAGATEPQPQRQPGEQPEAADPLAEKKADLFECVIKGDSRYVPLVVPETIQASGLEALPFETLEVKATSISGNARLSKKEFFNSKASRRPPAEIMEWSWNAEGIARLKDNPQRTADERNITYRHRESHTLVLAGYSYHGDQLIAIPPPDPQ